MHLLVILLLHLLVNLRVNFIQMQLVLGVLFVHLLIVPQPQLLHYLKRSHIGLSCYCVVGSMLVGLVLVVEVVGGGCSDGNTISYHRYLYYYNWVRWSCKYISDGSVGANGGNSIINNEILISLKQSVGVLVEMKTELIKMRQMVALWWWSRGV